MLYLHALDCRDLSLFYLFFAFFSKQTIKIDFCIVFLIFFSSYLIVMENLLLLIHIGSWRDLFLIFLACFFFHFLWLNELLSHIENIYQCYFLNLLWLFCSLAIQFINMIKKKLNIFQWLPLAYLNWKLLEKFLNNFICIITNHNFCAITFGMHQAYSIAHYWWHEINFHCKMKFSWTQLSKIICHIT